MPTRPPPPTRLHTKAAALARALWPGGWAAALSVVSGVVMTVGSAWVIAARPQPGAGWATRMTLYIIPELDGEVLLVTGDTKVRPSIEWPTLVPAHWAVEPVSSFHVNAVGYRSVHTEYDRLPARPDSTSARIAMVRWVGLPIPSLRTESVGEGTMGAWTEHPTSPWRAGLPVGDLRLPIKPILPAFLLNIAFWAAIPWLGVLAIRHARAARRARQGRCGNCRYPTLGLPRCPECGTPVADSKLDLVDDRA